MAAFPEVDKIKYEGPESDNPLAYHWYNEDEVVEGKSMKEHLRFSVVYWHTFRGDGSDPFGVGTMLRPWDDGSNSVNGRPTASSAMSEALGQQLGQVTAQMIAKNLNIAPTLEIRPGYRFNVIVTKDMTFSKPYRSFDY